MRIPLLLSENRRHNIQLLIIVCLSLGIFASDWIIPVGIGLGDLYIVVVLATLPLQNPLITKGAVLSSILLIFLGYWLSPTGPGYEVSFINRWLSIFCVLITGFIVSKNLSAQQALQGLKEDLETKVELRTLELKERNRATLNLLDDLEQTKRHLEEKESRLRLLIDAFPSGILIVDYAGRIVFANKLIKTLFGYSEQELVGQSVDRLVPERLQHEHSHRRTGFFHDPSTRAMGAGRDLFARRKDGSEFPVEIGLNPITTPEGLLVLSSVVDITARKQSEAEVIRLNQQLMAQNQELESYTYAVSHDLRTPLRAIHNYADFLLEDFAPQVPPEQQEFLSGITTAVCEAEELVSDLLELARLNVQDSSPQLYDSGEVIQSVLRVLNVEENVHIQTPTEWPTVLGHGHLLRQIFQNLIANVVKFNRSSPKRIEVNWRKEKNGFVRFSISDNGIGILPQYQDKIFQIFERLHTTREYEGTGIGLALVKKSVSKLGGEIRVESEIGKGSIFSFTVPMGENMHDE
jgi:PAS domain S-box-containing protein